MPDRGHGSHDRKSEAVTSDALNDADRDALRRLGRRNMVRSLPILVPAAAFWWLGDHWLRRRGVDRNLAWFGTLLAVIATLSILARLGVIDASGQAAASPRLRRLMDMRAEQLRRRLRWPLIVGLGLMLASNLLLLVAAPGETAFGGWDVVLVLLALDPGMGLPCPGRGGVTTPAS